MWSFVKARTLFRPNVRASQITDLSVMSNELAIAHEWSSKTRTAILVLAIALSATLRGLHAEDSAKPAPSRKNELPAEVALVLHSPDKGTLYSLEPWEKAAPTERTLHGFKVIGQMELDRRHAKAVAADFKTAIARREGPRALCFNPRHALSVTSGGATYDFLLCYECGQLEVFSGDRLIADLSALGTAKTLNAILSANNVPLSRSGMELEAEREQFEVAESRWLAAMPSALKSLWSPVLKGGLKPNLDPLRAALSTEFPDERTRILALYAWFGSGEGPWSGFPSYEMVAEELLLDFHTEALIKAAEASGSAQQLEGAARLFGGWEFSQRRPSDLARLPPDLKQRLLTHSLKSTDEDKRSRARHAFD